MTHSLSLLTAANHKMPMSPEEAKKYHNELVKQSKRLVSQTFFGAMLKQMRNSPFKSKLLDGGRGGEVFSSLLDQHLEDKMANSKAGRSMAESMANKIEAKMRKKYGIKDPPKPPKRHVKSAAEMRYERSSYSKGTARDGRKNVPADYRA
ncbi:MAG TPA: rod-binding protein [Tepidisphaeraceae bacterium]|nr:rod-binding protein [Tepidisphaeraceae bacterium]